jgi:hypothetical protein
MPSQGQVAAVVKANGPGRFRTDKLDTVGDDLDIVEIPQRQVLAVVRLDTVTSRRHDDPLVTGLDLLVDEALQIEGRADGGAGRGQDER